MTVYMTEWFPVDERLPEENKRYLVTFKVGEDTWVSTSEYRNDLQKTKEYWGEKERGWVFYDMERGYIDDDGIIAWMPLPEPYKTQ